MGSVKLFTQLGGFNVYLKKEKKEKSETDADENVHGSVLSDSRGKVDGNFEDTKTKRQKQRRVQTILLFN